MAFHSIRSMEKGERMDYETWQAYNSMPPEIRFWIDRQWRGRQTAAARLLDSARLPDVGDGLLEVQVMGYVRKMRVQRMLYRRARSSAISSSLRSSVRDVAAAGSGRCRATHRGHSPRG